MRAGAVGILIAAAGVAGYLLGARGGEGQGTPRRENARPAAVAETPLQSRSASAPTGPDAPERAAEQPARSDAPVAREDLAPPVAVADAAPPHDAVHAGSPFEVRLRDELHRGGPMALLRGLMVPQWGVPHSTGAAALVGDDRTFPTIFSRRAAGPVADGPGADWSTLADGTILLYPEGVFEIAWREAPERFPRDLVLKGKGMDRTLLRVGSRRGEDEEIHGLTIAAVTIDCGNGDLLRPKSGLAALRLVECRIVRADSILAGADAGAILAERCEFEGGRLAGGGPYQGCRLLATERGLARLDDCAIRGTVDVHDTGKMTCLFRRCRFVQVHKNLQSNLEGRPGVRLEDCRFEAVDDPPPPRPLSAIHPTWRD